MVVSKPARLYRRVGGDRPGEFGLRLLAGEGPRLRPRPGPAPAPSRQATLSELCRSMVLEAHGPAAVLINAKLECLFFQGPTDRYLKVASGRASRDVIGMAREGVQTKLRSAIQGALRTRARFVSSVGRIKGEAGPVSFTVVAEPAPNAGEELLLVCFVERSGDVGGDLRNGVRQPTLRASPNSNVSSRRRGSNCRPPSTIWKPRARSRWRSTKRRISVNEEYQSKNEELMASKEELQSLNEELNALNSQLQETLERQRTTANDLQNVLYSTDVATIFLDDQLQYPVLHAGDEGAVQCHSRRRRTASHRLEIAGARQ